MTTVEIIKADLPNTPDEVIDIWLLPHSKRQGFGWPPSKDNEWRYVLGLGRDLDFYRNLQWELKEIQVMPQNLTPTSIASIQSLYQIYHQYRYQRVAQLAAYIKEHGKFPRPVILEETSNGYTVLDGSHRITAYFYLCGRFITDDEKVPYINVTDTQMAWVATMKASSSV